MVGAGWRLLTVEEAKLVPIEGDEAFGTSGLKSWSPTVNHKSQEVCSPRISYRRKLARISPDDQSASGSSVWKRGASFGEKPDGTYWFSVADGLGRHFQHDTELPIWALKQLTTQDAKESVLRPSPLSARSDTTDTEIVALRQVYEALQRVAIRGSRRRVCEAALVLLGET